MGNKQFSQNNLNHLHKFIYIKNVNFLHPNHVKCKKNIKKWIKNWRACYLKKDSSFTSNEWEEKKCLISLLLMGILIEFNTSQAAKSQCYSYEAALLLQLKSGSAAASRQVERKVGLSGSKRRGEKKKATKNPQIDVLISLYEVFYLVVFSSSQLLWLWEAMRT